MIAGIDYGSKLAGTTVICYSDKKKQLHLLQSQKKKDADAMILKACDEYHFSSVYIDAPLSLPGVYSALKGYDDYFYRIGDKKISAMSPMFLGGLTARAMRLVAKMRSKYKSDVCEIYPGGCARQWDVLAACYKIDLEMTRLIITNTLADWGYILDAEQVTNWHRCDAVLAFYIGLKHLKGKAKALGTVEEGQIWI